MGVNNNKCDKVRNLRKHSEANPNYTQGRRNHKRSSTSTSQPQTRCSASPCSGQSLVDQDYSRTRSILHAPVALIYQGVVEPTPRTLPTPTLPFTSHGRMNTQAPPHSYPPGTQQTRPPVVQCSSRSAAVCHRAEHTTAGSRRHTERRTRRSQP